MPGPELNHRVLNKSVSLRGKPLHLILKKTILPIVASYGFKRIQRAQADPAGTQLKLFNAHLRKSSNTFFGKEHFFNDIDSYAAFKQAVPVRSYEQFKPYIDRIAFGEQDVLWKGPTLYFAKTSGTTAGKKYIPVTADSLLSHRRGRSYMMMNYLAVYRNKKFLHGEMLIFSEDHPFEKAGKIPAAAISSILTSTMPFYLKQERLPSKEAISIKDYDLKLDAMVKECIGKNITCMVGVPPWLLRFLNRMKEMTGKIFSEHFPDFSLLTVSGMNFEPYRALVNEHIQIPYDQLQSYPASEGIIGYQDKLEEAGMALILDQGIFYEFVPIAELGKDLPVRYKMDEVSVGEEYAIVLNTNAGLWGYLLGDTVKFISLSPPRILLTGRTNQYLSAFGEGMKLPELEHLLLETAKFFGVNIVEYTAAPIIPADSLPYYEWLIEFERPFERVQEFETQLNERLCAHNYSYKDLVEGKAVLPLKIHSVMKNGFYDFARAQGRVGGQNKIVRFWPDDKVIKEMKAFFHWHLPTS